MTGAADLTQREPSGQDTSGSTPIPPFTTRSRPSTGRAARSFIPRTGRMSPSKHRSLTEVLPRYLIAPGQHADFDAMFGRPGPLFVDIGFGMGESTVALATARPNANILAVDVHIAGHAMLANALADQAIANVRIIAADAHEVLLWMCEPASLTEVSIWFSDPWPKQRQSWRRLIQPDFVALVADRLRPGGVLRMATDWGPYATQMRDAIRATATLSNEYPEWAPRDPIRPITSYERKGIEAGRAIRDLVATRNSQPGPNSHR
jgi:tRNA (guanine-N7-)-methyltransferase